MAFSLLSNRNALGKPLRFRSASAAGLNTIETSYDNPLGTGDRRESIVVSSAGGWYRTGGLQNLVNGSTTSTIGVNPRDALGCSITFDFGTARHINEVRIYLYKKISMGSWQWVGSDDNTTWSDPISGVVELKQSDDTTPVTFPMAVGHVAYYRYYKIEGVSGYINDYFREFEFKIDAGSTT